MSTDFAKAFLFGFLGLAGMWCLVLFFAMQWRKNGEQKEYDERQKIERGEGFEYGYLTLLVYLAWYAVMEAGFEISLFDSPATGIFLGITISLIVFVGYCIWHHAYMTNRQTKAGMYLFFGGAGMVNLVVGIAHLLDGEWFDNGKMTFRTMNFMLGIAFLIFFCIFYLRDRKDRGQENEEQEE